MSSNTNCSILHCTSHMDIYNKNVLHFKFPIENEDLLKKWLDQIKQPNWYPNEKDYICSMHFKISDLINPLNKHVAKLKPTAVPSIFPHKIKRHDPNLLKKAILPNRFGLVQKMSNQQSTEMTTELQNLAQKPTITHIQSIADKINLTPNSVKRLIIPVTSVTTSTVSNTIKSNMTPILISKSLAMQVSLKKPERKSSDVRNVTNVTLSVKAKERCNDSLTRKDHLNTKTSDQSKIDENVTDDSNPVRNNFVQINPVQSKLLQSAKSTPLEKIQIKNASFKNITVGKSGMKIVPLKRTLRTENISIVSDQLNPTVPRFAVKNPSPLRNVPLITSTTSSNPVVSKVDSNSTVKSTQITKNSIVKSPVNRKRAGPKCSKETFQEEKIAKSIDNKIINKRPVLRICVNKTYKNQHARNGKVKDNEIVVKEYVDQLEEKSVIFKLDPLTREIIVLKKEPEQQNRNSGMSNFNIKNNNKTDVFPAKRPKIEEKKQETIVKKVNKTLQNIGKEMLQKEPTVQQNNRKQTLLKKPMMLKNDGKQILQTNSFLIRNNEKQILQNKRMVSQDNEKLEKRRTAISNSLMSIMNRRRIPVLLNSSQKCAISPPMEKQRKPIIIRKVDNKSKEEYTSNLDLNKFDQKDTVVDKSKAITNLCKMLENRKAIFIRTKNQSIKRIKDSCQLNTIQNKRTFDAECSEFKIQS